jgi:hypothetical protein
LEKIVRSFSQLSTFSLELFRLSKNKILFVNSRKIRGERLETDLNAGGSIDALSSMPDKRNNQQQIFLLPMMFDKVEKCLRKGIAPAIKSFIA